MILAEALQTTKYFFVQIDTTSVNTQQTPILLRRRQRNHYSIWAQILLRSTKCDSICHQTIVRAVTSIFAYSLRSLSVVHETSKLKNYWQKLTKRLVSGVYSSLSHIWQWVVLSFTLEKKILQILEHNP
jgi:hypothetical protein